MTFKYMSRDANLALLGAGRVGRLGFVAEGELFVVPMHYVFEEECIYGHSLPGHKIQALRAEPRACFQVDRVADDHHWSSVMVHGRYEEITDPGPEAAGIPEAAATVPSPHPSGGVREPRPSAS